jgi:hypothetical protein
MEPAIDVNRSLVIECTSLLSAPDRRFHPVL